MKAYKVTYYNTSSDGRVSMGTKPVEAYYFNKEEADRVAEEKENNRWIAMVSVTEIEINQKNKKSIDKITRKCYNKIKIRKTQ